ncbi:MAG: hypothetical protein CMP11_02860 [Zetaproteobacteria bacterium]|nr:hypothetical protein [Pseudobdellovibrionaceae bacterium]|tara:strand:- start:157 stop:2337 length:2181 start_codon:yes stop_codon:yes gene_type:complete
MYNEKSSEIFEFDQKVNSFSFPEKIDSTIFSQSRNSLTEQIICNKNSLLPSMRIGDKKRLTYLPIEFFREPQKIDSLSNFNKENVFRSSGTSSDICSKSYFSKQGLLSYRHQALISFSSMLSEFFSFQHLSDISGFSLIPTVDNWKFSSLAKMIDWISQIYSVKFIDEKNISSNLSKVSEPIWIFGTAFHYVNLHEMGLRFSLPKGSVIIETGGTKGLQKCLERADLYQRIGETFGLDENHIVSEYGMCELACQAYDFSSTETLDKRFFRFPYWVTPFISRDSRVLKSKGTGSLIVYDPHRIDYKWPIKTEDVVCLQENGSFQIRGRLIKAPAKGCSLLAEKDKSYRNKKQLKQNISRSTTVNNLNQSILFSIKKVDYFIKTKFFDDTVRNIIAKELGSKQLMRLAIEDLLFSLPQKEDDWIKAIENSKVTAGDRWLLILPDSHPFVIYYPLILGFLGGANISVRLPQQFNQGSSVDIFIDRLSTLLSCKINKIDTSYRIKDKSDLSPFDYLLCYGSNDTINRFDMDFSDKLKGFGQVFSTSIIDATDTKTLELAVKDAFSLGQAGCFSSQAIFFLSPDQQDICEIYKILRNTYFSVFSDEQKNLFSLDSLNQEISRYKKLGARVFSESNLSLPLFPFVDFQNITGSFASFLSKHTFVLPFFYNVDYLQLVNLFERVEAFKLITATSSLLNHCQILNSNNFEYRILGCANRPVWDGFHQKTNLFCK